LVLRPVFLRLQAVRDQIRKMVVGGPLVAEDKSRGIDAVSDSEDDETELAAMERDVGRWVWVWHSRKRGGVLALDCLQQWLA
jgi:hypothetical protein